MSSKRRCGCNNCTKEQVHWINYDWPVPTPEEAEGLLRQFYYYYPNMAVRAPQYLGTINNLQAPRE